ncbi:MAG TPA: zinc ribbon domain-containing protein [Rhizobiales bacterium]|nr:zinc ribbon domain-containing protein [Hyphomicrobiales bacterium]
MAEIVRFRCKTCGHRFEAEVLDPDEKREARRRNRPTSDVHCPKCNHLEIRRGWD